MPYFLPTRFVYPDPCGLSCRPYELGLKVRHGTTGLDRNLRGVRFISAISGIVAARVKPFKFKNERPAARAARAARRARLHQYV